MILDRYGNKRKIAKEIIRYFPKHKLFVDMFFGAGGLFFNKPKSKYNIVNDIDDDVYNLFRQVVDNKDELLETFLLTPICETQFKEWRNGKRENSNVLNAVRFLFLSNFSLYSEGSTLRFGTGERKRYVQERIDACFHFLKDVRIMNDDYQNVIGKIGFGNERERKATLIYADPPYINAERRYRYRTEKKWKLSDFQNLLDLLVDSRCLFAVSEFYSEITEEEAKKRGLYLHQVLERQSIKNRNTEILITNYPVNNLFIYE
jgi:DNA adenine methylase